MSLSATDQFQPFCWPPQLYYKIIVLICGPENGYLIQQYFGEKKLCASPLSLRKYDLSHKCAQGLPGKRGEGKGSSQCHPSIINQYIWSTLRHHHPSSSICMPMARSLFVRMYSTNIVSHVDSKFSLHVHPLRVKDVHVRHPPSATIQSNTYMYSLFHTWRGLEVHGIATRPALQSRVGSRLACTCADILGA